MTTNLGDGLPSTPELYAAGPFFQNSLQIDFAVWADHSLPRLMRERSPAFDAFVAGVQRIGRHLSGDPMPGPTQTDPDEWFLWVGDAVTGVYDHLDQASECSDTVHDYGGPSAVREILARLAVYMLELRHKRGFDAFMSHAGYYAQRDTENEETVRLILGMTIIGPYTATMAFGVRRRALAAADRRLGTAGLGVSRKEPEKAVIEDVPFDTTVPHVVVLKSADHLPAGPKREFKTIAGVPVLLRPAPDPAVFAADVARSHPWAAEIAQAMAMDLVGRRTARLRPTLLVSPPGYGKTAKARVVADALGLPMTVYGCGGNADGSFGGTSRQWSTGRASVPLQAIIRTMVANPVIVLDELDKAGTSDHNGRLVDNLLAFLERENSARIQDPYAEAPVDLSHVTYIATANEIDKVPGPLRDRFRIFHVPAPRREHLPHVAANIVHDMRIEAGPAGTFISDLLPDELDIIGRHWRGGSMRALRRMVEVVVAGRDAMASRN